jgi:hypothetical protein
MRIKKHSKSIFLFIFVFNLQIYDYLTITRFLSSFLTIKPDFKIYLGLASMSFFPELEQECIEQGIAVIKQVGDKVVINDSNLKVFLSISPNIKAYLMQKITTIIFLLPDIQKKIVFLHPFN